MPSSSRAVNVPLILWAALLSNLCMLVGWHWDLSWHRSIGRDTAWTLPHVCIYVALAISFVANSALILSHTFGRHREVEGLRVFGFNGPSGAFVALWGILAQFLAILFDSWWHQAYGLDIAVFSPPHYLLGCGITLFYSGQVLLAARFHNCDGNSLSRLIVLASWAFLLGHMTIALDPSYG